MFWVKMSDIDLNQGFPNFFFKLPPFKKLKRFLPPPTRLQFKTPKTFFFAIYLQLTYIKCKFQSFKIAPRLTLGNPAVEST